MAFDGIFGNRHAHERLKLLVERERVPHALLFGGPSGVGKRLAALEFAKLLLCPNGACGSCSDCRQIALLRHPHVTLLEKKPDGARVIAIDHLRDLLRDLTFTSQRTRVVIVDEAERMLEETQNAFLKTLEEPPSRCVIVMVTASPALLLPTIVSRCQQVLFTALAPDEMAAAMRKMEVPSDHEHLLLALADGLPGRVALLAQDIAGVAARAAVVLDRLAQSDLNPIIEELVKIRDTGEARERAKESLTIVALAIREALRARLLGEPPRICTPKLLRTLEAVDDEGLADRIQLVLDHQKLLEDFVNLSLAVEDALLRV